MKFLLKSKASTHVNRENIIFGGGVPRSGTTWLFEQFKAHPEIHIPYKEIHYFESVYIAKQNELNYEKGDEWYLSRFKPSSEKICADVCVAYFMDEVACERIHQFNPHAKVILTLRNPYEAIYSHYWQLKKIYEIPYTFRQMIERNENHFLEANLVYKPLMRFMNLFPRENLFIGLYDDLKKNPLAHAKRIFNFLGVDENFKPEKVDVKVNQRRRVKSELLRNWQSQFTEAVRRRPKVYAAVNWVYDHIIPRAWVWKLMELNYGSHDLYDDAREEERYLLEKFYQEDLNQFLNLEEFKHLKWNSNKKS